MTRALDLLAGLCGGRMPTAVNTSNVDALVATESLPAIVTAVLDAVIAEGAEGLSSTSAVATAVFDCCRRAARVACGAEQLLAMLVPALDGADSEAPCRCSVLDAALLHADTASVSRLVIGMFFNVKRNASGATNTLARLFHRLLSAVTSMSVGSGQLGLVLEVGADVAVPVLLVGA